MDSVAAVFFRQRSRTVRVYHAAMTSRFPRLLSALATLSAASVLASCSETGTTGSAPVETVTVVTRPLPETPPPGLCRSTRLISKADYTHPHLGDMRLFTLAGPATVTPHGCVIAVAADANVQPLVPVSDISVYGDNLTLPTPVSDSTGNAFVDYNPGRYNGVLVLVPTETGFEPIDRETRARDDTTGQRNFYSAELEGPGADGQYSIKSSINDCDPSCAGGTTTTTFLVWNGTNYVAS